MMPMWSSPMGSTSYQSPPISSGDTAGSYRTAKPAGSSVGASIERCSVSDVSRASSNWRTMLHRQAEVSDKRGDQLPVLDADPAGFTELEPQRDVPRQRGHDAVCGVRFRSPIRPARRSAATTRGRPRVTGAAAGRGHATATPAASPARWTVGSCSSVGHKTAATRRDVERGAALVECDRQHLVDVSWPR